MSCVRGESTSVASKAPARERGPEPILSDPNPGVLRWILHVVYDVAWLVGLAICSPWIVWRSATDRTFRRMVLRRLGADLPHPPAHGVRRVLVHGVSVGEVKAAQSLVASLEREPGFEVVISTTTDTGAEVAGRLYPGHEVVRFPIDLSFVVARFLRRVAPYGVVLIELEVWPNFLRAANRCRVPVAVANGRITDKSYGHYRVFRHLLPQFNRISLICVQDEDYAARFAALDADPARIRITGNIKVDGLETGPRTCSAELERLLGGRAGQRVLVAGSTHHPEERWVVDAWQRGAPDARLLLVPRHPERTSDIARELAAAGVRVQRLSELRKGTAPDPTLPVIVDTIGELEQVYALSDMVFVGGSLIPHGGQNMLEPAAQGRPVVYGPHVTNFAAEAALLERAGASVRVADVDALVAVFARWMADPHSSSQMSNAGRRAVEAQKGATRLTLEALRPSCLAERG